MKKNNLGGRPKILKSRYTILGCVTKEYHEYLKNLSEKLTEERGEIVSISHMVRIALQAMFPLEKHSTLSQDKNQMDFFEPSIKKNKIVRIKDKVTIK